MKTICPTLWFDGCAEEAAEFYTKLFPDSSIDRVVRAPSDNPSTEKGAVLVVEFNISGRPFAALNGGPMFKFNEAISFAFQCADQAEVDHYWEQLTSNGGKPSHCGWCTDRFGVSWQVIPSRLHEILNSEDRAGAERAMQAMLQMSKIEIADMEAAFRGPSK